MGVLSTLIVHAADKVSQGGRLDLTKPRYDQSTFVGRYKHFYGICSPITLLKSNQDIEKARDVVTRYKKGAKFSDMTEDEIWEAKRLVDSSVHPTTGRIIPAFARMSGQVPVNTFCSGAMLIFYKTRKEVLFWQWVNQSLNAVVNQANASNPAGELKETLTNYTLAVSLSLAAAIILSGLATKMPPLVQRLVPVTTVCVAQCLNVPMSRRNELMEGIQLFHGEKPVAKSKKTARTAISKVIMSRVAIALPSMVSIPIIMNKFDSYFKKNPKTAITFQVSFSAAILLFATPLGCALFPQRSVVKLEDLEPDVQEIIKKTNGNIKELIYNKGL